MDAERVEVKTDRSAPFILKTMGDVAFLHMMWADNEENFFVLSRFDLHQLLPYLKCFADTGKLVADEPKEPCEKCGDTGIIVSGDFTSDADGLTSSFCTCPAGRIAEQCSHAVITTIPFEDRVTNEFRRVVQELKGHEEILKGICARLDKLDGGSVEASTEKQDDAEERSDDGCSATAPEV